MSASISGKEWTVGDLFRGDFVFQIPPFQRPYAWGEEQTAELFDDIDAALGTSAKVADAPPYFLGSVVLIVPGRDRPAEVVDGQQRLTTLTILLAALREEIGGRTRENLRSLIYEPENELFQTPARYRLTLRKSDECFFRDRVQVDGGLATLGTVNQESLQDSQRNVTRNSLLLLERIRALTPDRRVLFAQYLVARCFLVVVSTANFDSAYRIFSVLNDRGLDLSHADVLKADVLGAIEERERGTYAGKWESIEDELGRDAFKDLFSHIRTIYVRKKVDGTVLSELRKHVQPAASPKPFVDQVLVPYANALQIIRGACYEAAEDASTVNGLLRWLERVDNRDWEPVAIVLSSRFEASPSSMVDVLGALERLAGVLMVGRADINERIGRFGAVLELLANGNASRDNVVSALTPTESERKRALVMADGALYENPKVRGYVLLRIDGLLAEAKAPHSRTNPTVEHVLPQTPEAGSQWLAWWPDAEERASWTHRLGNLLLLTRRKNSQASRLEFEEKKKKYFQAKGGVSDFPLTTMVLQERTWDPPVVARRQGELLEVLRKHWES